jgi:GNAT superfamily N-acetyltransferase
VAARAPVAVEPLIRTDRRAAARILAGAFLDDPAWVAVGPRSRPYRRLLLRAYYPGVVALAHRWGGPLWCARRDGRTIAVALAFDDGLWPPPAVGRQLYEAPFMLGGPGPMRRGMLVEAAMASGHPPEPHLYLWYLGADPGAQRSGGGRALLARLAEHADERGLPTYLETMNPDNVPYYRSAGFAVVDEGPLPRDARVWFMVRPPGGG